MFNKMNSNTIFKLSILLMVLSLLLSACSSADAGTQVPVSTEIPVPMATLEPAETLAPVVTDIPVPGDTFRLDLDTGSIATGFQVETIDALPQGSDAPYWEVLPEYTRVTLKDYPITSHLMKPQIFIYPVEELVKVNEAAGNVVSALESLLQSPQEIKDMPFLPLFNTAQMLHSQIQYLDFQSGKGLRYLTVYSQGITPINNYELIYTYQGITSDGKYYVAAVLPVNHPSLPVDGQITGKEPPEFASDFVSYLANVVKTLNPQVANTFTPDLTQLDSVMNSIEIR